MTGSMAARRLNSRLILRRDSKAGDASHPVLYVEFLKDGIPVDPGPWWAVNEGQKVRG